MPAPQEVSRLLEAWARRGPPSRRSAPENAHLPLKSAPVAKIDIRRLLARIKRPEDKKAVANASRYLLSATPYEEALAGHADSDQRPLGYEVPAKDRLSRFSTDDVDTLLKDGIIEPIPIDDIKANGIMFTVDELHKTPPCRRAIMWTDFLNQSMGKVETPVLDDVIKAAVQANGDQFAVCFDLVSSFFQAELATGCAPATLLLLHVKKPMAR